jgi:hypothetical protein
MARNLQERVQEQRQRILRGGGVRDRRLLPVPGQLLVHLSPLGWEHVNLTGDYIWSASDGPRKTVTDSARSGSRPILARPPEFVICPLMFEIQAFRYFWPKSLDSVRP